MANKPKYTKTDVMRAIRGNPEGGKPPTPQGENAWIEALWLDDTSKSSHGHIPTIAKRLGCSDQTVRNYCNERERLPEYGQLMGLLTWIRKAIKESDSGVYEPIRDMASINQNDRFDMDTAIKKLLNSLDDPDAKFSSILAAIKSKIVGNTWGGFTKQAMDITAAIEHEKVLGMLAREDFHHELKTKAEIGLMKNIEMLDTPSIKFALERLDKENYAARNEMTGADGEALFDSETMALLEEMGIDVKEALGNAGQAIKRKLIEARNKGKPTDGGNDTHSMERGDSE